MHQLLLFNVFGDTYELAKALITLGSNKNAQLKTYYEPAMSMGLDMLARLRMHKEIVATLIQHDEVMRALDYALANEVHGIKLKPLYDNINQAKTIGDDIKASMLMKRISDIRKVS